MRWGKPKVQPTALIVGLGNPGPEYSRTKHNVGFEVIDELAAANRIKLKTLRHKARYGIGTIGETAVVLAKPMTFMNLSGNAVRDLMRTFGLAADQILIVADELDLEPGQRKLKPKGGPAGHNGHRSIVDAIKTRDYARLKIGVGKPRGDSVKHVLSGFPPAQRKLVDQAIAESVKACETYAREGLERAMIELNTG